MPPLLSWQFLCWMSEQDGRGWWGGAWLGGHPLGIPCLQWCCPIQNAVTTDSFLKHGAWKSRCSSPASALHPEHRARYGKKSVWSGLQPEGVHCHFSHPKITVLAPTLLARLQGGSSPPTGLGHGAKKGRGHEGERTVTRPASILYSSTSLPPLGGLCWGSSHLQLQSAPEIWKLNQTPTMLRGRKGGANQLWNLTGKFNSDDCLVV